jgi:hypothetical protein
MPTRQKSMIKLAENNIMTNSMGFVSLNDPIRRLTPMTKKNTDSKRTAMALIMVIILDSYS